MIVQRYECNICGFRDVPVIGIRRADHRKMCAENMTGARGFTESCPVEDAKIHICYMCVIDIGNIDNQESLVD